jgi:dipeptidyl aminopeptidase/acylaminoacyl peptidase
MPNEITLAHLDGMRETIKFKQPFACDSRYYTYYSRRADGHLAVMAICDPFGQPAKRAAYLLEHDETADDTVVAFGRPLAIYEANIATFDPSGTRALVEFGSLLRGFYLEDGSGAHPITATVSANGKRFSLATAFEAFKTQDDIKTGNASSPDWSPDGSQIVFFATPDAVNRESFDRVQGEWQLYLMPMDTLAPRVAVAGIYNAHRLAWSPDGRYIAFIGQLGSQRRTGLWLYDTKDQSVKLISEGTFGDLMWSHEGKDIYAIRNDDYKKPGEVWQFDLSAMTPSSAAK